MDEKEYRAIPALSNSFLNNFDRSPAHAFIKWKPTEAMKQGTMIHKYILEPDDFDEWFQNLYCVIPQGIKRGASNAYKEFKLDNPDKEYIYIHEYEDIKMMLAGIDVSIRGQLMNSGYECFYDQTTLFEHPLFWNYLMEDCKGRTDAINVDSGIIFDVKKTQNASAFQKSVNDYKYHRQAAFYIDGAMKTYDRQFKFVFIAIEDTYPYGCKLYELNKEYLFKGLKDITRIISEYQTWVKDGQDREQVYSPGVEMLNKPGWLQ